MGLREYMNAYCMISAGLVVEREGIERISEFQRAWENVRDSCVQPLHVNCGNVEVRWVSSFETESG